MNNDKLFKNKYLKYKNKYLTLFKSNMNVNKHTQVNNKMYGRGKKNNAEITSDDDGFNEDSDDIVLDDSGWPVMDKDGYVVTKAPAIIPDGFSTSYDDLKKEIYVGHFKDNMKNGMGELYDMDTKQKIYEGNWKNDMKHGIGTIFNDGIIEYSGYFENGKQKTNIDIYNLPLYNNTEYAPVVNIYNKMTNNRMSFLELIKYIEYALCEMCDHVIKYQLSLYKGNYVIIGGKAINNIISSLKLFKSFDFDIHVEKEEDITHISTYIVENSNFFISRTWNKILRNQLFLELYKYGLVDNTCESFYMNYNLFYYGTRINIKNGVKITGLFVAIKLKNNSFSNKANGEYMFYSNLKTEDDIEKEIYIENIIYIPVADIETDALNFRLNLFTPKNEISKLIYIDNDIKYGNYFYLLYNLLNYISISPQKRNQNINKLIFFLQPLYYNCKISNIYNSKKLVEIIKSVTYDLLSIKICGDTIKNFFVFLPNNNFEQFKYNIMLTINNKWLYNDSSTYDTLLNMILNNYLIDIDVKKSLCKPEIISDGDMTITDYKPLFKTRLLDPKISEQLEMILYNLDKKDDTFFIYAFTFDLYKTLNKFLICNSNAIIPEELYYNINMDITNKISNNKFIKIKTNNNTYNTEVDYMKINDTISEIFENFNSDKRVIEIKTKYFSNMFHVFSLQQIYCFYGIDGNINIENITQGDIIEYTQYISTSFNPKFTVGNFIKKAKVLLKILINKDNTRWLYINNYSYFNGEFEILIKTNSLFLVRGIEITVVENDNQLHELRCITLELLNYTNKDIVMKSIKTKIMTLPFKTYNEPILKNTMYINILNYIYDSYFIKPYPDIDLGGEFNIDFNISLSLYNTNKNIYETKRIERNNHSLAHTVRVTMWIQLMAMIMLKNDYDKQFTPLITEKFIMQICIAGCFLITGRGSEARIDISRKQGFNYTEQSSIYFENYFTIPEYNSYNLFTEDDIKIYKKCISKYYYINKSYEENTNEYTPLELLISRLFYIAHQYDLLRCNIYGDGSRLKFDYLFNKKEKCDNMIDYYEIKYHTQLMIDMLIATGDRILYRYPFYKCNGEVDNEIDNVVKNYDPIFYYCSTDINYCIGKILDVVMPYFNKLSYDIMKLHNKSANIDKTSNINVCDIMLDEARAIREKEKEKEISEKEKEISKKDEIITDIHTLYPMKGGFIDDMIELDDFYNMMKNRKIGSTLFISQKLYKEISESIGIKTINSFGIFIQPTLICLENKTNDIYINIINLLYKNKNTLDLLKDTYSNIIYDKIIITYDKNMKERTYKNNDIYDIYPDIVIQSKLPITKTNKKITPLFPTVFTPLLYEIMVGGDNTTNDRFKNKYLKYKAKYIKLRKTL